MMLVIAGGWALDPAQGLDGPADVVAEDGIITRVGKDAARDIEPGPGVQVVNAEGMRVLPGLVDMHVHLREPGQEYKETIATGTRAAAVGGFTAVCCMANTIPVNDNAAVTKFILDRAAAEGAVRVYPAAAATRGQKGAELADFGDLAAAGARAVSDDGHPVSDAGMMRRVLEYAADFGLAVLSHPEDLPLANGGSMNEGALSTRMGLPGIPAAAEAAMVARDILLAQLTGLPLHLCHVSCFQSVEMIRLAKERGVPVTAETAPHYFSLTEDAVAGYNTNAKMNPPLRAEKDREAVCQGLADGTIDAIASDHAPHSILEKDLEFDQAAFGIVGLETSLSLSLALVRRGVLTLKQLVLAMSTNPARILGLDPPALAPGAPADVTVVDPDAQWVVDPEAFFSKGRNTPFAGMTLQGRAACTVVGGRVVHGG
ncbi:MAG: dihydroorotase [Deltaproteobacteria bacterium]|nr:dihydroorotase [Deltaproteobacteria bacterium]